MSDVKRDAPALEAIRPNTADNSRNHLLDEAVIAALPKGLTVLSTDCYGTSAWSATASIRTEDSDGQVVRFFIKYATGEHGRCQLEGEFRSMQEIHKTVPRLAPTPFGIGQLESAPTPTYFFLCEFVNISDRLPDAALLGKRIAKLHRDSVSPTGMFGFHCTTYDGKLPQNTGWEKSWPSFFTKLLLGIAELDVGVNGPWDELQEALDTTVQLVIPRLLGALEQNGRSIKPCLIHGDLWEGNTGTDLKTGDLYIFDAASYYGHNEMELGIWRTDHHRMSGLTYKREYEKNFQVSEPVEEWDDRNRLYCIKTQLMYSAHVPGSRVRKSALDNLNFLIEKYGCAPEKTSAKSSRQQFEHHYEHQQRFDSLRTLENGKSQTSQPIATTIEV